jgi:MFS family permease
MRIAAIRDFFTLNAPWLSAGALLMFLSSFGQTFFISLFAGEIRAEFGLSHGQWGGIYTLGTAASAAIMVWAGGLTDRFRVRTLAPVVLLMLAGACIWMATAQAAWVLPGVIMTLRFCGQGMTSHVAVVAMARWFVKMRGRALSIALLGFAAGEAVLPIVFVSLMEPVGWRILWLVAAGMALLGIPLLLGLLRRERTPQSWAQDSQAPGMDGRHWTRRQAFGHQLFWFMVPALLGPSAFNTAFFFQQVHYAEIKGWAHLELVALFPVFTAMSIGAMVLSGWALDKWGTARLMPFYQLPMVAGFIAFAWAVTPAGALVGMFFLAVTSGANSTLINAFWAEFYGTANIGAIKAMAAAVMVLGSAIGPGITGVLIDLGIGIEAQYLGVAIYFLFASAMMTIGVLRARPSLPVPA